MFKFVVALLIVWNTTAFADVDDHFSDGVLGVGWGAALQRVQAVYPGGLTWPQGSEDCIGDVVYAVPGDFRVLGVDTPVRWVHFVFTEDGKLQRVFFHFVYADREAALFGVAQVLSQDYSISDGSRSRKFSWKRGRNSAAQLVIGNGVTFPWAFFAVRTMKYEPSRCR